MRRSSENRLVGRAQTDTHLGPDVVLRCHAADRRVMDSGERHDSKGSPFTRVDWTGPMDDIDYDDLGYSEKRYT